MPRNTSRRVQVQSLEDPQGLKVPNAVNIPSPRPQVNAAGSELMQLSAALEDLNPAITRLGVSLFQKSQQEGQEAGKVWAITNPKEAEAAAKLPWKEAVQKGLLPEGANPFFVTAAREQYGQQQVLTVYKTMLSESKPSVVNALNPVDIDEAIGEKRKAFLEGLGDNFYARKGAAQALGSVEETFRTQAISERTQAVEALGKKQASINGHKYADQLIEAVSGRDLQGVEVARAQVRAHLNELDGTFKDSKRFYADNVVRAVALDIAEVDRNKALRYIDEMRNLSLNDNGAKFGGSGEINLTLDDIEDRVNAMADREEQRDYILKERRKKEVVERASDVSYNLIERARSEGKNLNEVTLNEQLSELDKQFGDNPDFLGIIKNSHREIFNRSRDTRFVSNQNVVASVGQQVLEGRFEAAEEAITANVELGNLSPVDALRLKEEISKEKDTSRYLNDLPARAALNDLEVLIKAASLDPVVEQGINSELTSNYQRNLRAALQELRAQPGTKQEFEAKLPEAYAKAAKATETQLRESLKTRKDETDRRADAAPTTTTLPLVSPKLVERVSAVSQMAENVASLTPEQQAGAKKLVGEVQTQVSRDIRQVVGSLRSGGRSVLSGGLDETSKFIFTPFTPQETEQQLNTYYQLKSIRGYQPAELLRSVTDEGFPVDISKVNPYQAPVYPNEDALKKSYDQFLKGDLEGVFGRYLKLFKVDPENKESVDFFLQSQIKLTQLR